ncbi:MAG: hypothetical protein FWD05_07595 [Oscillospiraceae bacterium]|nr:hypothetical protein [Oscillospiraceae bacterium]
MAIINEIKCARCDRKYSGVRSRCPYCGARRVGHGKYSENSENMRGKMLISVLILAVFTVGVGILWFSSAPEVAEPYPDEDLSTPGIEDEIEIYLPFNPIPEPTPTPTPTPPPPQEIHSIEITYAGVTRPDFTVRREETVGIRLRVEPPGIDLSGYDIVWASSNPAVVDVVGQFVGDDGIRNGASVTGITAGAIELTVTIYNPDGEYVISLTIPVWGR